MYFKTGFLCLLFILYLERLPGRGSRRTGFPVCTREMSQSGLGKGTLRNFKKLVAAFYTHCSVYNADYLD